MPRGSKYLNTQVVGTIPTMAFGTVLIGDTKHPGRFFPATISFSIAPLEHQIEVMMLQASGGPMMLNAEVYNSGSYYPAELPTWLLTTSKPQDHNLRVASRSYR